jgi:hypothetical protein
MPKHYKQTSSGALTQWKTSPAHNDVIQNKGMWERLKWKAMGASVDGGHAVLWFGEEEDTNCQAS